MIDYAAPEVTFTPRPRLPLPALAAARGRARRQVATCTRCPLAANCRAPVPYNGPTGNARSALCIAIGEAPGNKEDELGKPFIGPAGRLLRALLTEVGIWPDDVMFANVVSCMPKADPEGRRIAVRAPTDAEVIACRENLAAQIHAADTDYVLLIGGSALNAWRKDLKISRVHGQVFVWDGQWVVMPIYHPAAILRDRGLKAPTLADLTKWTGIVKGEVPWSDALGEMCIRCPEWIWHLDPDGVGYCREHWKRYGDNWQRERVRRGKEFVEQRGIPGC